MARPINQISQFRNRISAVLSAIEQAQASSQTIDYLGGAAFYRSELDKVDDAGAPVYDITTAQMTNAINALGSIKALLEANNQVLGKALARMRE